MVSVLAGCGDDGAADDASGGRGLTVTARAGGECDFPGATVDPGLVDVSLVNESDVPLFVITLRIDEGRSFEDIEPAPGQLEQPDFTTISARTFVAVDPGDETVETLAFISPGEYVVVCSTESPRLVPAEAPVPAPNPLVVRD